MAQVSDTISMLSQWAIAVFSNSKQQTSQFSQSDEDSNYITEISAHHQAVAHIRDVQAEYLLRGWMR
ncbi:hypothetical protein [Microcoleus sp. Pol12B4]|uniref:hypothetical protein n=1 Tax=Microcoleus sp. Pol12B4 TaxID=3055395 RepID=UPI002FD3055B